MQHTLPILILTYQHQRTQATLAPRMQAACHQRNMELLAREILRVMDDEAPSRPQ